MKSSKTISIKRENMKDHMNASRVIVILLMLLAFPKLSYPQDVVRPKMWGVAKMTWLVSEFRIAREYYGEFLGFDEAFSYQNDGKEIISFKVNDHQFLEFIEDSDAKNKQRLVSVSFECDDISQMEAFVKRRHLEVVKPTGKDGAGNETLIIRSPEKYNIEFIHFSDDGIHKGDQGKHLADSRISKRIHHAGLSVSSVPVSDAFYKEIFGFRDMWRYQEADDAIPNFIYVIMPDCVENIEYIVKGSDNMNESHPCFKVTDMQETVYTLKERSKGRHQVGRPIIGKGKRWLLNMMNEDKTLIEFTEQNTAL